VKRHRWLVHPIVGGAAGSPLCGVPLSMIDVVFLLLIFLLVGQFPVAEGLLSMPLAGESASGEARQTLWIHVRPGPGGRPVYLLNDWPATDSPEALLGNVRDWVRAVGSKDLAVVIGADSGVPVERLVELWEGCRAMGVGRLALPAGPPADQP
jgi:biopolymer transport protein ExbD